MCVFLAPRIFLDSHSNASDILKLYRRTTLACYKVSHYTNAGSFEHGLPHFFPFSLSSTWNWTDGEILKLLLLLSLFFILLYLSIAKLCEPSEVWSQALLTINIPLDHIRSSQIWSNPIQYQSSVTLSASDQYSLPLLILLDERKVWNYSTTNSTIQHFSVWWLIKIVSLFSVFLHKQSPTPSWPRCLWVIWFLFISAKLSGLSISPPCHLQLKYMLIQSRPQQMHQTGADCCFLALLILIAATAHCEGTPLVLHPQEGSKQCSYWLLCSETFSLDCFLLLSLQMQDRKAGPYLFLFCLRFLSYSSLQSTHPSLWSQSVKGFHAVCSL